MDHYKMYIDGEFVEAQDGKVYEVINPGSGEAFATVAQAGESECEKALTAARRAFDSGEWRGLTPYDRAQKIYAFSDQVLRLGSRLAVTESTNGGHVISYSKLMPGGQAAMLRNLALYAATKFPWEEEIPWSGNAAAPGRDYIRREPIGVCVGIVPWNFPMVMAFWKIAQAIIMGNTTVLKPASLTPLSALIIAQAAHEAGIPPGVVNVIPGPGGSLGKVLCTHPFVDKISFTGSTEVGSAIMKMASGTTKKVTLELGGKSANIILDDADIDYAVDGAVLGTFLHQGQICESGTRILVHARIYDEFIQKLKKRTEALRVGYQLLNSTHIGPLVSGTQLATVEKYVNIGKEEGAQVLTGGKRVDVEGNPDGFYYAPTVFVNVDNKMRIAQEEIFGPVVCVIKFENDEEAVEIANDSIYGLGGGVFSSNNARAEAIAAKIHTGTVWINNYHQFGDFCPFGGNKQSGIGREMGEVGLAEFTTIKRVHVAAYADSKSHFVMNVISDRNKLRNFQYYAPTKLIAGHGVLASIRKEVPRLGGRRVLIMTDEGVERLGLVELVRNALSDFYVGTFDQIPQDSDFETVDAATDLARRLKADCIVSVGGGSVIDTAKVVCVALKNGGRANDHIAGRNRLFEKQTPHIVIPTTSGTGSEVTTVAVIKSEGAGRKLFISDPFIMPDVAVLDPRFTMTMPASLTASTGMDAMTHAIDAMTTIQPNLVSDGMALQAIRLIKENLPIAVADGQNEEARHSLQVAASIAGWAFTIAATNLAHAMAHTLGMLYGLPHGIACGLALPKVMRFNVDHCTDRLAQVALALGVNTFGMEKREAALAAADEIEALMKEIGHPLTLKECGIENLTEEDLLALAAHAGSDACTLVNGRQVTNPMEIRDLFEQIS